MSQAVEKSVMGTLEAARYAGLTYHTWRQLVEAGQIRPLPGTKKYRRVDIDALIRGQKGGNGGGHTDAATTE